jgi:RNA polymerase sigma-70 factor (ECF subfamily)
LITNGIQGIVFANNETVYSMTAAEKGKNTINPEGWLDEHGDYLYRYAYVRTGNASAAEELVQETIVAGYKARESYDGRVAERYWLRGILRHKIVDFLRRTARETTVAPSEDDEAIEDSLLFKAFGLPERSPDPWQFDPHKAYAKQEFWTIFYKCLAELGDRVGAVFSLRELEGRSTEEICKDLDISPNNMWVMMHRARGQLKACLEANWSKDDHVNV